MDCYGAVMLRPKHLLVFIAPEDTNHVGRTPDLLKSMTEAAMPFYRSFY
jgi:hypothetical protein